MSFRKDVNATVSRPVPFEHLAAEVSDIAKMKNIVILLESFLIGLGCNGGSYNQALPVVVGLEVLVEVF